MKEIKTLKRWPCKRDLLLNKITIICRQIDEILTPQTPVDVLNTEDGKTFYKEEFNKIFSKIGYRFSKPLIDFSYKTSACTGGIIITVYLKDREGELMQIKL